ncbi:MAG: hypothetical protein WCK84_13645 [Bacteroidota bacterium]
MTLFTKVTKRNIDDIYREFERFFTGSIINAESRCYDHGIDEYKTSDYLKYIEENKVFDQYYASIINEIKIHLVDQLSNYNKIQLISFIEKQKLNYHTSLPGTRKRALFNDFLVYIISGGDQSILNSGYRINKYEKSIAKLGYIKYSNAYCQLGVEVENLFVNYQVVLIKSAVIHNFTPKVVSPSIVHQQPMVPLSNIQPQPTAAVKALFLYYLCEAKEIRFPMKNDFEELMKTYHFIGSWKHVYNLFGQLNKGTSDIMHKSNLKLVIELLSGHNAALRLADNDLYQIVTETMTKIIFLPVFYYFLKMFQLFDCNIA